MPKPIKRRRIPGRAGPHHEVSPMGHATRTKSRHEKQARQDKRDKQKGWEA
jgi:hypothetical protein